MTLREQVTEIMNKRTTQRAKREQLLAIGITENDIRQLFFAERNAARQARRAALEQQAQNHQQQEAQNAELQARLAQARLEFIESIIASYTFGVEIECYNVIPRDLESIAAAHGLAMHAEAYNHTTKQHYKLVSDASIRGNNGIECVTPVLRAKQGFDSLKACCESLAEAGAKVNRSTGLHIHVGSVTITTQQYVNTFVNYMFLEQVIDSFMAQSRRANNNRYCRSLVYAKELLKNAMTKEEISLILNNSRFHKVNPCSFTRHHTIEFRQHQGTIDYEKISNWARFCIKLVHWSADHRLNAPVRSIDDVPFLTDDEKSFFKDRANAFAGMAMVDQLMTM